MTYARDPSCDACRRMTSGDCGAHGPLTIRMTTPSPEIPAGLRTALILEIEARIRSGAYLTYHAGPRNLATDALDAALASPKSAPEPFCLEGHPEYVAGCPHCDDKAGVSR